MKTIIFVDGANFLHGMSDIGISYAQVNYHDFFSSLLSKDDTLEKVKWYKATTFNPIKLKKRFFKTLFHIIELRADKKDIYALKHGKKEVPESYQREAALLHGQLIKWVEEECNQFEKSDRRIRNLVSSISYIEFPEGGVLNVNPFKKKKTEKGVDVSIAVDIILHCKDYKIILLSNDTDLCRPLSYVCSTGIIPKVILIREGEDHFPSTKLVETVNKNVVYLTKDYMNRFIKK